MKKKYVFVEIGIVGLVLLIAATVFVPKYLGNQSRAQLKQIETALDEISNYCIDHADTLSSPTWLFGPKPERILLDYSDDYQLTMITSLQEVDLQNAVDSNVISHIPKWDRQELEIYLHAGFRVLDKDKKTEHKKLIYVTSLAYIGGLHRFQYCSNVNYKLESGTVLVQGNFFDYKPFDISNGVSSLGYVANTKVMELNKNPKYQIEIE